MVNAVESNLLLFVEKMREIPNSEELLTEIFELHFMHTEKDTLAMELHSHITNIFKIDAMTLLQYLADMKSSINSDDSYIKTINRLKMKYGYFINELLKRIQNPFLIAGAEFNVENGSSIHRFSLRRVDGMYFEAQFNPGTFLPIVNLCINSLRQSIERGIYNLNEQDIMNFLTESNQLADLFKSLLQTHKGGKH
jgi:hypothetical protein